MTSSKQPPLNPAVAGLNPMHPVRAWQTPQWVLAELQTMADALAEGEVIGEIGVGAGSFARQLAAKGTTRVTVDLPFQPSSARSAEWPLRDDSVDLLISFDAIQYVQDVQQFVRELARVTRTGGLCNVLVRSREDLEADGLARFFPAAVEAARSLAPEVPVLEKLLEEQGLACVRQASLAGERKIDTVVLQAIAHREMIGLATLTPDEFAEGVSRIREAVGEANAEWPSRYTLLVCRKERPWQPLPGHASPE